MLNQQATTICIARRLAQHYKENQQAVIVQTAARLLPESDAETKDALMQLIAASPARRQEIVSLAERDVINMNSVHRVGVNR